MRPYILYHKITMKCNCKCEMCDYWKRDSGGDMSTDEVRSMLIKAKRAGIKFYSLLGGEPLLRRDVGEVLEFAKRLNLNTSLCTNCALLKERAHEITPFLDSLFVSLDSHGKKHDSIRSHEGLFKKAMDGIKEAKRQRSGLAITIRSVLSKSNCDDMDSMVRLSRDLGAGIEFTPMGVMAGYNEAIELERETVRKAFRRLRLLKKAGYPIRNTYNNLRILEEGRNYACDFPKKAVLSANDGSIYSCEHPVASRAWGNIKSTTFGEIFQREDFRRFMKDSEPCNLCSLPCVLKMSSRDRMRYVPFLYPFLDAMEIRINRLLGPFN